MVDKVSSPSGPTDFFIFILRCASAGGSCFQAKNKPWQLRITLRRDREVVVWLTARWLTKWNTESSSKRSRKNCRRVMRTLPAKPQESLRRNGWWAMSSETNSRFSKALNEIKNESLRVHSESLPKNKLRQILTTFIARSFETEKGALCECTVTLIWST